MTHVHKEEQLFTNQDVTVTNSTHIFSGQLIRVDNWLSPNYFLSPMFILNKWNTSKPGNSGQL